MQTDGDLTCWHSGQLTEIEIPKPKAATPVAGGPEFEQ
jgi:hypothetical protein